MYSKSKKMFLVVSIMIALSLVLSACGEQVDEGTVFKVGFLGPYSGPSAQTGKQFKGGIEIALEGYDYKIGPYTIEPVRIDSQSDPAKASQAYEQAVVQDGIQAFLDIHRQNTFFVL